MKKNSICVILWGTPIGYLMEQSDGLIGFQYDPEFIHSGIEISPLKMPLSTQTYSFPELSERTYYGLPGLFADSLPDRFGNLVLEQYLSSNAKSDCKLTPLERLCYTGKRGMGALEYEPSFRYEVKNNKPDLEAMAIVAEYILKGKTNFIINNTSDINEDTDNIITQLMESASSVGGARAKTLIAINPVTNEIRSGQIDAGKGYDYWILKFDNIKHNRDKDEFYDESHYTLIEYAYYKMALAAGIIMDECRIYHENNSSHFMTHRFDRKPDGGKLHMQTLNALAHMDYNHPRVYSYEDAFEVMLKLKLSYNDFIQLFRRMIFNELARNYDDHTKNISFLMDKKGKWSLSPAYDMTFSFRPESPWVSSHQMLINNKSQNIESEDFYAVAKSVGIRKSDASQCIEEVTNAIKKWTEFATDAGLKEKDIQRIKSVLQVYKASS